MEQALPVLEIGVVLLVAGLVGVIARRLGLPAVVGYLGVGLVVGPFTPGYVADRHQIQVLADVGVVLLLFEVGIELDLRSLAKEPRGILLAVPLQVALVTALGAAAVVSLGGTMLGGVRRSKSSRFARREDAEARLESAVDKSASVRWRTDRRCV